MSKTNPARGMRDFLSADVRKREYVIGIIKEVYESYGFEPLETPAVENLDTLMGKYGEEGNQLIFKILKRGEKLNLENVGKESDLSDLALRYDLTVPLARVVAHHKNELPKFFKRYQIQPVWRADRPAKGRFREFYQCDVDAIGSTSVVVEAELISAVSEILTKLGFDDYVIRINHRDILTKLLFTCNIKENQHIDALIAVDKLDKIGTAGVLKELTSNGVDEASAKELVEFLSSISNELDTDLHFHILKNFVQTAVDGAEDIETIVGLCGAKVPLKLDVSLARGLSYYTGAIFEVTVPDLAGSLGGGGRYDGLIGMFGKEQIPACGFSLGLERILVVMEERGMFPPEIADSAPADVMVTIWSEETVAESLKLAAELRSQGLRVTVYPEPDKLGKQMKYADQIRVPYVAVLGETELAERKVTIKNMTEGKQTLIDRSTAAEFLKNA